MSRLPIKAFILLFFAIPLSSRQLFEFGNGQKLFVVAVRTLGDAPVLSTCPLANAQKGTRIAGSHQFPMDPVPYHAPQLFLTDTPPIPGGVPDDKLRVRIEKEFNKRKEYFIVDDLAQADLVFFAEVRLNRLVTADLAPTDRIKKPNIQSISKARRNDTSTIPLPDTSVATGPIYVRIGGQDQAPNSMEMASAIVVRTKDYLDLLDNIDALLKARIWEASSGPKKLDSVDTLAPGVLESLAKQFLAVKKSSPSHSLCAPAQPHRVSPSKAIGTYRTSPPTLIGKDTSKTPPSQNSASAADPNTITISVSLVTVPLTATDPSGTPVLNLNASDFHVFEDGVEQKIDRVLSVSEPFNVALLLDTSRSMRSAFNEIRGFINVFLRLLRIDDKILLSSFNSRVYLDCEFTSDRDMLLKAASNMRDGVYTRMYDALYLILIERLAFAKDRKALVLVTDGLDTGSGLTDKNHVVAFLQEANAPIYVILYDGGAQGMPVPQPTRRKAPVMTSTEMAREQAIKELHSICDISGGRLYEAGTLGDLDEAFTQIARILRQQYTLCYYPSNTSADASFRTILVKTGRPEINIKARSGYKYLPQPNK